MKNSTPLLLILFAFITSFSPLQSARPESLTISIDPYLSMYTGADHLHTAFTLYRRADYCWLNHPFLRKRGIMPSAARLTKLVALDYSVAYMTMVTQHEIYGHGARLREFGIHPGFEFNWPPPFGPGGAATFFSTLAFAQLSPLERNTVSTAGVEADGVFSEKIALEALDRGCIDYHLAGLYLKTYHDQTDYILSLRDRTVAGSGHDINSYIENLNNYYASSVLSRSKLRSYAWANFADTATILAFYANANYLIWANRCSPFRGFCFRGVKFLPGARLTLAPYGPEFGLYSHFKCAYILGTAYIRAGETDSITSVGTGVNFKRLWCYRGADLGLKLDVWSQPDLFLQIPTGKTRLGGLAALRLEYPLSNCYSVFCDLGAKTKGFAPGEILQTGAVGRFGIKLTRF